MLLSSKGVPDTQSREENETPRETAGELADTFPICQLEGSRVLGWLWAAESLRPARRSERLPRRRGTLFAREVASRQKKFGG